MTREIQVIIIAISSGIIGIFFHAGAEAIKQAKAAKKNGIKFNDLEYIKSEWRVFILSFLAVLLFLFKLILDQPKLLTEHPILFFGSVGFSGDTIGSLIFGRYGEWLQNKIKEKAKNSAPDGNKNA